MHLPLELLTEEVARWLGAAGDLVTLSRLARTCRATAASRWPRHLRTLVAPETWTANWVMCFAAGLEELVWELSWPPFWFHQLDGLDWRCFTRLRRLELRARWGTPLIFAVPHGGVPPVLEVLRMSYCTRNDLRALLLCVVKGAPPSLRTIALDVESIGYYWLVHHWRLPVSPIEYVRYDPITGQLTGDRVVITKAPS